jgi:hypothetical protein
MINPTVEKVSTLFGFFKNWFWLNTTTGFANITPILMVRIFFV